MQAGNEPPPRHLRRAFRSAAFDGRSEIDPSRPVASTPARSAHRGSERWSNGWVPGGGGRGHGVAVDATDQGAPCGRHASKGASPSVGPPILWPRIGRLGTAPRTGGSRVLRPSRPLTVPSANNALANSWSSLGPIALRSHEPMGCGPSRRWSASSSSSLLGTRWRQTPCRARQRKSGDRSPRPEWFTACAGWLALPNASADAQNSALRLSRPPHHRRPFHCPRQAPGRYRLRFRPRR